MSNEGPVQNATEEMVSSRIASIRAKHQLLVELTEELYRGSSDQGTLEEQRVTIQEMIKIFEDNIQPVEVALQELKNSMLREPLKVALAGRYIIALTYAYNVLYDYLETADIMIRQGSMASRARKRATTGLH